MPLLCGRTTGPRKYEYVVEINKDYHLVQISVHYVLCTFTLDTYTFIQQIQIKFFFHFAFLKKSSAQLIHGKIAFKRLSY